MNRLFKMAGFGACFVAVLVMTGGHWLALQSVAWGRMVMDFAQRESVGTAIAKTFSGQHPCSMCLKIRAGWQHQKEREEKLPWIKIEQISEAFWQLRALTIPVAPTAPKEELPFVPRFHTGFINSPPTPPPRICLGVL